MQENLKQYLEKHNFSKQLKNLKKKLQNKTVIIYGTGKLFQTIIENYDLTGLNIIGVTDKKYIIEDQGKFDFGYKIIPHSNLYTQKADYILLAVKEYQSVQTYCEQYYDSNKIIPFVKHCIFSILLKRIKQSICKKNNTIILIKRNGKKIYNPKIKNLTVSFRGCNNYIEIHEPFIIYVKMKISCSGNSSIKIETNNKYSECNIYIGNHTTLEIGKNTTIGGAEFVLYSGQGTKITVGDDCMISTNVQIRTSDGHSLYDTNSRKLINPNTDIIINNHVWIGTRSLLLKGTVLPPNSVVGAMSLVNKTFEEPNSLIAGIPAKVIKRNINWSRQSPPETCSIS